MPEDLPISLLSNYTAPNGSDVLAIVAVTGDGGTKKITVDNLLETLAKLTGRTGGQILIGGTAVADILKLQGTAGNGTLTAAAIQALVGNAGGTVALTILNNGNVGIGTTGPVFPLQVSGTIAPVSDTVGNLGGSNNRWGNVYARNYYSGSYAYSVNIGRISPELVIDSTGNVGIGTTSPSYKLDVNGTLNASATSTFAGWVGIGTATPATGDALTVNGVGRFGANIYSPSFSVPSYSTLLTQNYLQLYSVNGARLSSTIDGNLSIGYGSATTTMYLSNQGNVGIGTTGPTSKLHLAAGTATAGTAPLGFTSGTLLTVPVVGKVEFLTDDIYFTQTTSTLRKRVLFNIGKITNAIDTYAIL
jgi:hypothetical protein